MEIIILFTIPLIITLVSIIIRSKFQNRLLEAELRGSYTANIIQRENIYHHEVEPDINPGSVPLFFFMLCVGSFFLYIILSVYIIP